MSLHILATVALTLFAVPLVTLTKITLALLPAPFVTLTIIILTLLPSPSSLLLALQGTVVTTALDPLRPLPKVGYHVTQVGKPSAPRLLLAFSELDLRRQLFVRPHTATSAVRPQHPSFEQAGGSAISISNHDARPPCVQPGFYMALRKHAARLLKH